MNLSSSIVLSAARPQIFIWLIGVSFVLFQFFLQLSAGVVIGAIMQEAHLSALAAGMLSSAFYYVYTSLQIPVGMLFDRYSTRLLLSVSALVCSFGCLFFAQSHHLIFLFIGRLLIGAGSAFAFVGLAHLLRQHFPLRQFAFIIGLSETLGFLVTVLGIISLGALIHYWGWRLFINLATLVGLLISFCIWRYIPENNATINMASAPSLVTLINVVRRIRLWVAGLFVGLSFSLITVFAAMWAVPFIQTKLNRDLQTASLIDAAIFLGAALSCPLFGLLANRWPNYRRSIMFVSCSSTAIVLIFILYAPIDSAIMLGLLMFIVGLCCGAYMLAYTIANELSPPGALSTSTGFVNTLAILSAPILQPVVGFLLDWHSAGHTPQIADFQWALMTVPICLIIASFLVVFLPNPTKA